MKNILIVGTGGVGGSIAGFLALDGHNVTCIARGEHLQSIKENGLHLKSGLKGEHFIKVNACTAEEYNDKADLIFVCVKGYSLDDSIKSVIERAAKEDTLVIPILNVYGTGTRISKMVPHVTVLDGCIYIVGFVSGKGEITQMGKVFKLIFGARKEAPVEMPRLQEISDILVHAGIKVDISDDINRDTFVKWAFISAMACTGAYHNVTMGALQHDGDERSTFIGLSTESAEIAKKCGIVFLKEPVEYNLSVIDKLDPQSTASMQKDIAKGHQSEIQGMLFDMIELGEKLGVEMPTYRKVEKRFR